MANDHKEKRFLLRLNQQLYDRLEADAATDNRSVNAYIVKLLEQAKPTPTFEGRQIIGKVIAGRALNPENGLVAVSGIYYRYLLDDNGQVDATAQYAVIEANGNILTLRHI